MEHRHKIKMLEIEEEHIPIVLRNIAQKIHGSIQMRNCNNLTTHIIIDSID